MNLENSHGQRVTALRTGVDLASVEAIGDSVQTFGDKFVNRIYTLRESAYCTSAATNVGAAQRFAARFAAKEAVIKILRPQAFRPTWTSIEVVRHDGGWCEILLAGTAARMAAEAGITEIQISMSHEGGMAIATAAAFTAHDDVRTAL